MNTLRAFFTILGKPDSYRGRPGEWAANQITHALFVGFGLASVIAYLSHLVFEPWPDQRTVFVVTVVAYVAGWEWFVQGWRKGRDSFVDSAFVALGAAAYLRIDMSLVIEDIVGVYLALIVMLAPGVYARTKEAQGARDDEQ